MRAFPIIALFAAACGPGGTTTSGTGSLQVFASAEDTIPRGLQAGGGDEDIRDGWTVEYTKFLVTLGNFRASRSDTREKLGEPKVYLLDLKALPANGFVIAEFKGIAGGRWDKAGFDLPNSSPGTLRAPFTSQADFDVMAKSGWSIYFEATLTKGDGKSCLPTKPADCVMRKELKVKWGLAAGTSFDDCAPPMGDGGFAIPAGGTAQVKPTVHGDHWFFTNLTQGAEITQRRAQWIVDSDLDRNGETTLDELKQVKAADVFRSPTYNLSGAIIPIATAHDYLEAQARTLGDYQGEGECPTRRKL